MPGRRLPHLLQHLILVTESDLATGSQHQQPVDGDDGAWAMRDDDDHAAAGADLGQRCLAFGIEIGIGLVEHDQERLAEECPCETYALPLPGREQIPLFADYSGPEFKQRPSTGHGQK